MQRRSSNSGSPLPSVARFSVIALVALLAGACSRAEVQVNNPPPVSEPAFEALPASTRQTAAKRIVEIDRLLAEPITGRADDSDRRAQLRAERAALLDSGQVPAARIARQSGANHNGMAYPDTGDATVTRQGPKGDVVHYAT